MLYLRGTGGSLHIRSDDRGPTRGAHHRWSIGIRNEQSGEHGRCQHHDGDLQHGTHPLGPLRALVLLVAPIDFWFCSMNCYESQKAATASKFVLPVTLAASPRTL